jgi:hypothetical protein
MNPSMRWFFLSLALGLSFGVVTASCSGAQVCDVRTCPNGCCGAGGRCVQTPSSQECGTRGQACMSCSLGQTCTVGMCQGGFGTGAGVSGAGGGVGGGGFGGGTTAGGAAGGSAGGSGSCNNGCLSGGICRVAGSPQQNNNQCGNLGLACRQCVAPLGTCAEGSCIPSGAGGGASGGGSAGGGPLGGGGTAGGGPGPACPPLPISSLPGSGYQPLRARYVTLAAGVFNDAYYSTSNQQIGFEFIRAAPGGVPVPYSGVFDTSDYNSCEACLKFGEQCAFSGNMASSCVREFLAQSGSVTFGQATENASSGQFSGSVSNVILRQWNFVSDTLVPGGACYTIPVATFTASWP